MTLLGFVREALHVTHNTAYTAAADVLAKKVEEEFANQQPTPADDQISFSHDPNRLRARRNAAGNARKKNQRTTTAMPAITDDHEIYAFDNLNNNNK